MRNQDKDQDATAKEDAELHHIGPDDRLDAPEPRVEYRDRGRDDNGKLQVDVQNLRQNEGRSVQQDSRTQQQVQAIEDGGKAADRAANPYRSESFGGYAYTAAEDVGDAPFDWRDGRLGFSARLRPWRKL